MVARDHIGGRGRCSADSRGERAGQHDAVIFGQVRRAAGVGADRIPHDNVVQTLGVAGREAASTGGDDDAVAAGVGRAGVAGDDVAVRGTPSRRWCSPRTTRGRRRSCSRRRSCRRSRRRCNNPGRRSWGWSARWRSPRPPHCPRPASWSARGPRRRSPRRRRSGNRGRDRSGPGSGYRRCRSGANRYRCPRTFHSANHLPTTH